MPFDALPEQDADAVATVLRRAANIIRERGWCQYVSQDSQGRVCMGGAISIVVQGCDTGWNAPSVQKVFAALPREMLVGNEFFIHPSVWNNAPDRTPEEVIQALEACALSRCEAALKQGEELVR